MESTTERLPRKRKINKGDLAVYAGGGAVGLASLAAVGAVLVGTGEKIYNQATGQLPDQIGSAESKALADAVKTGQKVPVLEGGQVKIDLTDSKFATLKNPVISPRGHVMGIDRETGKIIVFYNGNNNFDGSGAAQKIEITENGKPIVPEQALLDAKTEVLSEQKTSDGYSLSATEQGHRVNVGELDRTKVVTVTETNTTTETVPDK